MSSTYRKIQYETMGPYGSTEKKYLYIHYHNTCDIVNVYDEAGVHLFSYDEWGDFDMGKAIVVALSDFNNERLESLTPDEIQKFFK